MRWFWGYSPPYFRFADFLNKAIIPAPATRPQLLACCVESSRSLECVLKEQCGFHQFLKMYCSFWPHDAKSGLNGKDPGAGKDCGQEKRATEDEMAGWHYPLNEDKFEKTLGDSEGQGSLVCCSSWSWKESDSA